MAGWASAGSVAEGYATRLKMYNCLAGSLNLVIGTHSHTPTDHLKKDGSAWQLDMK